MLSWLADRLVLCPTRHAIAAPNKRRRLIAVGGETVEVWMHRNRDATAIHYDLYVLKFPGTGGRAERAGDHPLDFWCDLAAEIWSVNPPGYGCSSGRAQLRLLAPTASAVFDELERAAAGRPILLVGNSLGTCSALYLAAHRRVAGLLLRNVIPLRELIACRHARTSFGLSRLLAVHVPQELHAAANAARCEAPAVFVVSGRDRTSPPEYQQQVIDAYAGPKRVYVIPGADHATPIAPENRAEYAERLNWLRCAAGIALPR